MTGTSSPSARSAVQSAKPSMPGIRTSLTTHRMCPIDADCSSACPLA
jgi:hypothetical protein